MRETAAVELTGVIMTAKVLRKRFQAGGLETLSLVLTAGPTDSCRMTGRDPGLDADEATQPSISCTFF